MKVTVNDMEEKFNDTCLKFWSELLEMVSQQAPEDALTIEQHSDVFYKVFKQGMHRGWNSGALNLITKLKDDGAVDVVRPS
jgi:hypothetical protein